MPSLQADISNRISRLDISPPPNTHVVSLGPLPRWGPPLAYLHPAIYSKNKAKPLTLRSPRCQKRHRSMIDADDRICARSHFSKSRSNCQSAIWVPPPNIFLLLFLRRPPTSDDDHHHHLRSSIRPWRGR